MDRDFSESDLLALLNLSLRHEANWWKGKCHFSNIYSFVVFAEEELMKKHPVIFALCQYILLINYEMVGLVRTTTVVREDEYSFPPNHDLIHEATSISKLKAIMKKANGKVSNSEEGKLIKEHLKLRFNLAKAFLRTKAKNTASLEEEKANDTENAFVEAIKTLRETHESIITELTSAEKESEESKEWASTLYNNTVAKTIHSTVQVKIFAPPSFEETLSFFSGIMRDLIKFDELEALFKYPFQIAKYLKENTRDDMSPLVRSLYEKFIFPEPTMVKAFRFNGLIDSYCFPYVQEIFPDFAPLFEADQPFGQLLY